jgi:hypothetical protein
MDITILDTWKSFALRSKGPTGQWSANERREPITNIRWPMKMKVPLFQ